MKFKTLKLWRLFSFKEPRNQPGSFRNGRVRVVSSVIYVLLGVIASRSIYLALFPAQSNILHKIADNQYQTGIELAPYRGAIYDRSGDALAISIKRPSVAVNPQVFNPTKEEVRQLSKLLKVSVAAIEKVSSKRGYFSWIARQIDPRVAEDISNLKLDGLTIISEPSRFYPSGSAAANLLGFIGLDNSGLAGLERQLDHQLKGQPLRINAKRDAKGHFIYNEASDALPVKTGNHVYLTIDRVIQEIAEEELEQGVKQVGAKGGFAIVSDPHTGRVLAVANYPSFDPNHLGKLKIQETRNAAFLDTFEPGSVVKPFVIAKALDQKVTSLEERHNCENGAMRIGKHTIHDTHGADYLTTLDTIIRSSNICTYKIANKLGKERLYKALMSFGFASETSKLGYPGETSGRLSNPEGWPAIRFANVAFGHGFATTGLEIVQAMGAIANGGHLMKPALIEKVVSSEGLVVSSTATPTVREVMSPETARYMRQALRSVVIDPHGTGKKAQTALFSTAGKTGTAQKVITGVKGYAKGKYISSFIGFTPVQDPHLVIYVLIDEPSEKVYYGGETAAPVFARITERSLKYLNVAPDILQVSEKDQHATTKIKL